MATSKTFGTVTKLYEIRAKGGEAAAQEIARVVKELNRAKQAKIEFDKVMGTTTNPAQLKQLQGELNKLRALEEKLTLQIKQKAVELKAITELQDIAAKRTRSDGEAVTSSLGKYRELLAAYREAKARLQELAAVHGTESREALAAAENLAVLKKQLTEINNLAKAGPAQPTNNRPTIEAREAQRLLNLETKNTVIANKAAEGSLVQLRAQLSLLNRSYDLLAKTERDSAKGKELLEKIKAMNLALTQAEAASGRYQRNVGNYKSAFDGLGMSFTQITRELPSLTISAQQFFLAISNNLPMLADEIGKTKKQIAELKAEGKPAPSLFKTIAGAMFSWQTLLSVGIVLLTAYGSKLVDWVSSLFAAKKKLDELKESAKLLNEAIASTEYKAAIKNVNELTINIELAKKGLLDKQDVLEQYNDTIGKTTGQVTSLDEAERELGKNAEAYVKMTLYKAAANLAAEEAAKKLVEAEQARLKKEQEFQTVGTNAEAFARGQSTAPGFVPGLAKVDEQIKGRAQAAAKAKAVAVKESEDAAKTFEDIEKKFRERAAKIATDNKFDPFGDADKDKKKSEKDAKDKKKSEKDAKDRRKLFEDSIRKQQAAIQKAADEQVKTQEARYVKGEIDELEYQKRKYDIVKTASQKLVDLEKSLGKGAEDSRISGFREKQIEAEIEFTRFLQRQAEERRKLAAQSNTDVTKAAADQIKKDQDIQERRSKVFEDGQKRRYDRDVEAENKRYGLLRAGRTLSFNEEIKHLERLRDIRKQYGEDTAELDYQIELANIEKIRRAREERSTPQGLIKSSGRDLFNIEEGRSERDDEANKALGQAIGEGFSLAKDAMNGYFDAERARIQESLNYNLQRIDADKQLALSTAQTAAEKEAIEKQYAAKERQARRTAGEELKKSRRTEAKINLAAELSNLAIAAASAGAATGPLAPITIPIIYGALAAMAFGKYAIRVGEINREQFSFGGQPDAVPTRGGKFKGKLHSEGGTPFRYKGNSYEAEVDELSIIRTKNAPTSTRYTISGNHTEIASALNRLGGGVEFKPGAVVKKFAYGGAIGGQLKAPVFTPAAQTNVYQQNNNGEMVAEMRQMRADMQAMANEQSRRIDRLQVNLNPNDVRREQGRYTKQSSINTL